MIANVRACLEQQTDCELAHIVRTIDRYVHDRDILRARILIVHDIVARREHSNRLQIRARIDRRLADRRLVDDNDLRVTDALRDQR